MKSDEDDISWWRTDARDLARWTVRTVRGITRADLIFTGFALALLAVALFVWPATPIMSLIWLPPAVGLFIWPDRAVRAVKQRMEQGDDSYFEQQRALRAYPIGTARQLRRGAGFAIVMILMWSALHVESYIRHHLG